jgi:hypothetical protein
MSGLALDPNQVYPEYCSNIRDSFSSYLDGAVSGHEMQTIAAHLEGCTACGQEFEEWKAMQRTLASLKTPKAPEDLGLRLRLAISREQAARQSSWRDSVSLLWENTLRPLSVQLSAGLACAVALIAVLAVLLGVVPPPNAVLANDEPLGAITAPHYLYSAETPRPIVLSAKDGSIGNTIVVEALVNSQGRVYDYDMLTPPDGPEAGAIESQIVDQLLLSVFKPASVFGVPVKGRVVLTFAGVSARGLVGLGGGGNPPLPIARP